MWRTGNDGSCDPASLSRAESAACGCQICLLASVDVDPTDFDTGREIEVDGEVVFELGSHFG